VNHHTVSVLFVEEMHRKGNRRVLVDRVLKLITDI
jgi:hypothetical protein